MDCLTFCLIALFLKTARADAFNAENGLTLRNAGSIITGGTIQPYYGSISNVTKRNGAPTHPKYLDQREPTTYAITQCPQQCKFSVPDTASVFKGSRCAAISLFGGTWSLACGEPTAGQSSVGSNSESSAEEIDTPTPESPRSYTCDGHCRRHEVCYHFPQADDPDTLLAYCVDHADRFKFEAKRPRDTLSAKIDPPAELKRRRTHGAHVEVVLSGDDDQSTLYRATAVSLRAVDTNDNFLGNATTCKDCDRLMYGPLPEDTVAIIVEVALPNSNDIIHMSEVFYAQ